MSVGSVQAGQGTVIENETEDGIGLVDGVGETDIRVLAAMFIGTGGRADEAGRT